MSVGAVNIFSQLLTVTHFVIFMKLIPFKFHLFEIYNLF